MPDKKKKPKDVPASGSKLSTKEELAEIDKAQKEIKRKIWHPM